MARRNPPTSPMTFSAGTRTSSSTSSPVSTPRTPILWSVRPTDDARPSDRSTMKAVIESWARLDGSPVLAKTVYQSASTHSDIQHLVPVEHPVPVRPDPVSGTARVRMPATSLPACGLGQTEAGPQVAGGDARQIALLLVVVAGDQHRPHGEPGQQEHQGGGIGVLGHLLDGDGQSEDAGPRPPELHRQAQAEEVGIPERLEEVGRVVAGGVDGAGPRFDLVLGQPADALLQLGQFGGEVEVHGRRGYPRGRWDPTRSSAAA